MTAQETLDAAIAALTPYAEDSNTRFASGDRSVTTDEGIAIVNLVAAMKGRGNPCPEMVLLDLAVAPLNFRNG